MDGTKKISFGFNKLSRKSNILINKEPVKPENTKVQLIEYLEEQSIKVIGDENNVPVGPLVIPMKAPNKNLINLVDIVKNDFKDTVDDAKVKTAENVDSKDEKTLTLDELAAKELINGASNNNAKNDVTQVIEVPVTDKVTFDGEKESSLDDYESVPVDQFGKAMLRGMGWKDGQGIGKNQQLVKMAQPVIRPKGMGLGADSLTKKSADTPAAVDRNGKVLTCVKGAYVKVIAGYHKGYYGQILGFDDESGRFIIKLTLTNINVSLNEFLVTPVTKDDYNKNSKVLNNAKYEEYLKRKEQKENPQDSAAEKQHVKTEPAATSDSSERNSKVRIKQEPNYSSNDEQPSARKDWPTVAVKKEKDNGQSAEKHREGGHKSKERTRSKRGTKERKKKDSDSEVEHGRRTDKYSSDEEYATGRRNTEKKGKRGSRNDSEQERRAHSSRRHSDSESEDRSRVKKRDSSESNRKSRKDSRKKRYTGSGSEDEEKHERKTNRKDKYRDRSRHSAREKRK